MAEKNVECVMVELCQRLLALRIGIAASKDLFRRSSSHALPGVAMFTVVPVVDPLGCSQDRFAGWRQRRLFALPEQELPVLLEQLIAMVGSVYWTAGAVGRLLRVEAGSLCSKPPFHRLRLRMLSDREDDSSAFSPRRLDQAAECALRLRWQLRFFLADLFEVFATVDEPELRRAPSAQDGHPQRGTNRV